MTALSDLSCQNPATACGTEDIKQYSAQLAMWQLSADNKSISRRFEFKNFKQTMFFINAAAYICEQQGHHPDAKFGFNYCEILFTTHDAGGLTLNDFICAAKLDALLN